MGYKCFAVVSGATRLNLSISPCSALRSPHQEWICISLYVGSPKYKCPSLRILQSLFIQGSYTGLDSSLMVDSYQAVVNCGGNSKGHLELTHVATL
ncbi:hypothetical protein PVK06_020307 [Gossypium arboreum]|uniref:Uncharacterized protein n=1 Tax=Gossypium arboreum TaxID=29729 RepID=A0ABR0PM12_GOSAR|nr:hypothetical protein PVK06_020307 [Gossypium arboreum]